MKRLMIETKDMKEGDLVISKNGSKFYFILKIGKTFLHSHPFMEVIFNDGDYSKFYFHEIDGPRIVFRIE